MFRRIFLPVLLAVALAQSSVHAASISFGTPSSGQNYAVGAPISYSGTGSWNISGGELRTGDVYVDLVWYDPNNVTGPGTIVESDRAIVTYDYYPNGTYKGTYSFVNSEDANRDSNLIATQYQGNNSLYYLKAKPQTIKGTPYLDGNNNTVITYLKLGTIS